MRSVPSTGQAQLPPQPITCRTPTSSSYGQLANFPSTFPNIGNDSQSVVAQPHTQQTGQGVVGRSVPSCFPQRKDTARLSVQRACTYVWVDLIVVYAESKRTRLFDSAYDTSSSGTPPRLQQRSRGFSAITMIRASEIEFCSPVNSRGAHLTFPTVLRHGALRRAPLHVCDKFKLRATHQLPPTVGTTVSRSVRAQPHIAQVVQRPSKLGRMLLVERAQLLPAAHGYRPIDTARLGVQQAYCG